MLDACFGRIKLTRREIRLEVKLQEMRDSERSTLLFHSTVPALSQRGGCA